MLRSPTTTAYLAFRACARTVLGLKRRGWDVLPSPVTAAGAATVLARARGNPPSSRRVLLQYAVLDAMPRSEYFMEARRLRDDLMSSCCGGQASVEDGSGATFCPSCPRGSCAGQTVCASRDRQIYVVERAVSGAAPRFTPGLPHV